MNRNYSSLTLVVFCCSALPEENTVKPRTSSRAGSIADQNISIQTKTLSPSHQPKLTGEKRKTKHSEKV